MQPGARCDRALAEPGRLCNSTITIGAPMWLETHRYDGPTIAHRSFAVVSCEQCRLLEIAHEWADAADVPPHAIHHTNRRGLAGRHMLTPDQYARAARAATALIEAATRPEEPAPVEPPPAGHVDDEALVAREARKVRPGRADDRSAHRIAERP